MYEEGVVDPAKFWLTNATSIASMILCFDDSKTLS
jgi:hypothetical protein